MKKVALLSLFVLLLGTFAVAQCGSNCLFYAGDFDANNGNANGLANETDGIVSGSPYGSATYQNFIVDGGGWHVDNLFTNNLSGLNPSTGYWEIRSGVSEGNGGTLVASGTTSMTQTPTGRNGFGFIEYRDEVGVSVDLAPDQYWLAVVPNDPNNQNRSFNSNTFGANAVGNQTLNDQFWNSSFFGVNYTNANNGGTFPAFSAGVIGTESPEPSSLIMLGSGLVGVAGVIRRRLSR